MAIPCNHRRRPRQSRKLLWLFQSIFIKKGPMCHSPPVPQPTRALSSLEQAHLSVYLWQLPSPSEVCLSTHCHRHTVCLCLPKWLHPVFSGHPQLLCPREPEKEEVRTLQPVLAAMWYYDRNLAEAKLSRQDWVWSVPGWEVSWESYLSHHNGRRTRHKYIINKRVAGQGKRYGLAGPRNWDMFPAGGYQGNYFIYHNTHVAQSVECII